MNGRYDREGLWMDSDPPWSSAYGRAMHAKILSRRIFHSGFSE